MRGKRRRQRDERQALQVFIDAMVENAEDPRRQALADVIEVVLKRAGFQAATIGPTSTGSYPASGTRGFWMRVDSIGPGIMLYATGYGDADYDFTKRYLAAILDAFSPIIGKAVTTKHVVFHLGGVCIVPFFTEQIQMLHQRLAR